MVRSKSMCARGWFPRTGSGARAEATSFSTVARKIHHRVVRKSQDVRGGAHAETLASTGSISDSDFFSVTIPGRRRVDGPTEDLGVHDLDVYRVKRRERRGLSRTPTLTAESRRQTAPRSGSRGRRAG